MEPTTSTGGESTGIPLLQALVEQAREAVIGIDPAGSVIFWNLGAELLIGVPAIDALGRPVVESLSCEPPGDVAAAIDRIISGSPSERVGVTVRPAESARIMIDFTLSPVRPNGDRIEAISMVGHDVTHQQKNERRLALQNDVSHILSTSSSLESAACELLETLCRNLGWETGILWRVDSDAERLRCLEIHVTSGLDIPEFIAAKRRMTFAMGEGLPGLVWRDGMPIAVEDLATTGRYPRIVIAAEFGMHGALAFPVRIAGEVLGVIEFFTRAIRAAEPDMMELIEGTGAQIAHILERHRADRDRTILLEREQKARSEAENARRRFAFLAEASAVLASSLDYQTTLSSVAWLAVPHIADWAAVDMLKEDGTIERLAVAHIDPEKIKWAYELQERYPIDMNAPTGLPNVLRTGKSEFYPDIPEELLRSLISDPEQLQITLDIGFTSVLVVPIIVRDKAVGGISFVSAESGRHYDQSDLALAEDIARRAGVAIENAMLYSEVREQREWLHVTLSSIGDAVIATDENGHVTFMNHVASSLIGWTAEEAEGRDLGEIFNIVNEESGDAVESPVLKVIREGATVGLANHTVLISRDGRHTPIDDSAAPIRDHMGRIVGVVMVFHDITERRQAERERAGLLGEVERGRERLTNIIRTIPGVVWETWGEPDAATQKTDFISDYVETMLGYTVEEWLATPRFWLVVTHPDDRERVERDSAERYRQGINGVSQFRWIRKDGRVIWVESRSTVTRDDEGRPIGLRGVSMDITATKEAEIELLAAKEEAESANQAKDQFLAVLSHELRTPLTPVLAITQVLENSDELSDELRPIIEMVRRNVELEARLIDDLLDLTRVSKGKLQLNMETVDIHAHLANVLEMCQSDIRGKELAITIDLEARRYHAQADPARIQQVFWNLVKNAVKFTPKGGEITVTSFNNERGDLVVEVTDTGIGIEPELVPKIFDAFEQGSQSITRQYGGLGLGLAISRALVEMHGGTLSAVSQGEGSGSKFVMEIATVDPPVAGQTRRNGDNGELHGTRIGRILLVDDHIETSTVLKLLLERRGYTVETAHTVADALALALAGEFDILISDIGLPDGSGLDLMRAIRREKDLPGIALSGFGMEEDLERSREAGFAAHLTKPVGFQRLQDAISKVLAG